MEINHIYSESTEKQIKEIDSILENIALRYKETVLKLNSENIYDELRIKKVQSEYLEEAKPYIELQQKILGNALEIQVVLPNNEDKKLIYGLKEFTKNVLNICGIPEEILRPGKSLDLIANEYILCRAKGEQDKELKKRIQEKNENS